MNEAEAENMQATEPYLTSTQMDLVSFGTGGVVTCAHETVDCYASQYLLGRIKV